MPNRALNLSALSRALKFNQAATQSVKVFMLDAISDSSFRHTWMSFTTCITLPPVIVINAVGGDFRWLLALGVMIGVVSALADRVLTNKDKADDYVTTKRFVENYPKVKTFLDCYDELVSDLSMSQEEKSNKLAVLNMCYTDYIYKLNIRSHNRFEKILQKKLQAVNDTPVVLAGIDSEPVLLSVSDDVQDVVRPQPATVHSKRVGVNILNMLRNRLHQHVK